MTFSTKSTRVQYAGDGAATAFTIPFVFDADADIAVKLFAADGAQRELVQGADYTLSGAGSASGGVCTLSAAPAAETTEGAGNAEVLDIRLRPCAVDDDALPIINPGDAGKGVVVAPDEDGFVLSGTGCGTGCGFDCDRYKAPAPVVLGEMTVESGDAIALTIADHKTGDVYTVTRNPLGLGLNGNAIAGTAPEVAMDTLYELRLTRVRPASGLLYSDEAVVRIEVRVPDTVTDPEILIWEDNATDWPEADRNDVSVGTDQMEPTGAVLRPMAVDSSSTVSSLVLTDEESGIIEQGDWLLLDGGKLLEVPGGMGTSSDGAIVEAIHTSFDDTSDVIFSNGGQTSEPTMNNGGVYITGNGYSGSYFTHINASQMPHDKKFTWVVNFSSTQERSGNSTFSMYQNLDNGTGVSFGTWGDDFNIGELGKTTHGFDITSGEVYSLRFEYNGNGTFDAYNNMSGELISSNIAVRAAYSELVIGGAPAGNVTIYDWRVVTGSTTQVYTIPCSPALASVPSSVSVLPELYMAAGEDAADADEFVALEPASATAGANGTVVTCEPEVLPDDTRALSVGIAGDGWSAYAATKEQEADQGDWTQATVSMTLGDNFYKDATASMLMEG